MPIVTDSHLRAFVDAAHRIGTHQLLLCSSGNLSWRINEQTILISQTGSWLPYMTKDQICIANMSDGVVINNVKPSMDSGFHFGVLRARKDVNVVLHFQSLYGTTLASLPNPPINFNVINEVPQFIGPIAMLDYICPGSPEIGRMVTDTMRNNNLLVLRNHGQVVVGKDFDEVIQRALFFELACGIIMRSNNEAVRLTEDQICEMNRYMKK
ncbi:MAG TPA: class II aldolase/adducin family protein [Bacteroidales bacterium]|nr:class II aldolase/adducin family protein [Bacteroidales bacterium]HPT01509.1 class II aldolase/adducin family protein [Bacteroidales bacterium]